MKSFFSQTVTILRKFVLTAPTPLPPPHTTNEILCTTLLGCSFLWAGLLAERGKGWPIQGASIQYNPVQLFFNPCSQKSAKNGLHQQPKQICLLLKGPQKRQMISFIIFPLCEIYFALFVYRFLGLKSLCAWTQSLTKNHKKKLCRCEAYLFSSHIFYLLLEVNLP